MIFPRTYFFYGSRSKGICSVWLVMSDNFGYSFDIALLFFIMNYKYVVIYKFIRKYFHILLAFSISIFNFIEMRILIIKMLFSKFMKRYFLKLMLDYSNHFLFPLTRKVWMFLGFDFSSSFDEITQS
jgi:hypothetical protein